MISEAHKLQILRQQMKDGLITQLDFERQRERLTGLDGGAAELDATTPTKPARLTAAERRLVSVFYCIQILMFISAILVGNHKHTSRLRGPDRSLDAEKSSTLKNEPADWAQSGGL